MIQELSVKLVAPTLVSNSVVIVAGPSGSGKTTIAKILAKRLGCSFLDADRYHSESAKKGMSDKIPVTDAYRSGWIDRLTGALITKEEDGEDVILACSCLKRHLREKLLGIVREYVNAQIKIVWLDVPANALSIRLENRKGHFFPKELLASQLEAMEVPSEDEVGVVKVNCLGKTPDDVADEIVESLFLQS